MGPIPLPTYVRTTEDHGTDLKRADVELHDALRDFEQNVNYALEHPNDSKAKTPAQLCQFLDNVI